MCIPKDIIGIMGGYVDLAEEAIRLAETLQQYSGSSIIVRDPKVPCAIGQNGIEFLLSSPTPDKMRHIFEECLLLGNEKLKHSSKRYLLQLGKISLDRLMPFNKHICVMHDRPIVGKPHPGGGYSPSQQLPWNFNGCDFRALQCGAFDPSFKLEIGDPKEWHDDKTLSSRSTDLISYSTVLTLKRCVDYELHDRMSSLYNAILPEVSADFKINTIIHYALQNNRMECIRIIFESDTFLNGGERKFHFDNLMDMINKIDESDNKLSKQIVELANIALQSLPFQFFDKETEKEIAKLKEIASRQK